MFKDVMMLGGGKELKSAVRGGLGTNKFGVMAMVVLFFVLTLCNIIFKGAHFNVRLS